MNRTSLVLAAVALAAASTAGAVNMDWLTQYNTPNMHYGQVQLHPYYNLSQLYDSNIYLVPRDQPNGVIVGGGRRESWITKNVLGFDAVLPWHRLHELQLGYGFDSELYTTQPEANDAFNQTAHADYAYSGAYGVTFRAGDKYVNTTDPAFSQLTGRQRRWENDLHATLDYSPTGGRLAAGLDAGQVNDKYVRPDLAQQLNRYEQVFGFNVGYRVRPKTKVYLAYHRDLIHYSVAAPLEKDSRTHNIALGVDGQLAPKWEGHVEGGFSDRKYDVIASTANSRVFISASVSAAVLYHADAYTDLKLGASRRMQESVDASNPLYFENVVSAALSHRFPRKFSAGVTASFELDQYPFAQVIDAAGTTLKRRDDIYQYGAWVNYDIQKWITTGVAFNRRERDSTLSGQFDFEENLVSWTLGLKF